jgi:fructose-1,6-bisphosphatase/inositol monophosphatase family enzyme
VPLDQRAVARVTALIRLVADTVVLPSFRSLRPEDIRSKATAADPDDVVTSVDHAAERFLVEQLRDIVPGAVFLGEEAICANPTLLDALPVAAAAWLIDPVDGTKNFAKGNADFGVMVALVEHGATTASWMAVPAASPPFVVVAGRGEGAWIDGVRVSPRRSIQGPPRGTVHTRMAPRETADAVVTRLDGRYDAIPSSGSAATEYSAVIRGDKDFVIYYRLLPWDHAPGALAITEAGGLALHLTGEPYTALSPSQITIFAATPELAQTIRGWLQGIR